MCVSCAQNSLAAAESIGLDSNVSKVISIGAAVAMLFSVSVPLANPTTTVKSGATCVKVNQKILKSNKTFVCKKSGKKLVWKVQAKKPAKQDDGSSTSTPNSSTPVQLPTLWDPCPKLKEKVYGNDGYMKCVWMGGPTNDFLKNIRWRYYPIYKTSSSKSNNYARTPVENAECTNSGDTWDITGGMLECRWINGKKLQWIKVNTVKSSFVNATSPVPIDTCKLKNSASKVVRTGRDYGHTVGFPLENSDRNGMFIKGTNEVLIVPIDFPDFPGGNEVLAQVEYDKKWMIEWFNHFSNGQSKFNVTTKNGWLRMPKERSAYPSNAKTIDAAAGDHGRRMADQAQPFIDEITKEFDLRKFSTVYFFYPDGEYTFVDFIVRNQTFIIKEGQVRLNLFSWGKTLEAMESLKWAFYVHETLHDFAIPMHAPGNGWPMSIGTNQLGVSLVLNPWEQFLLGWLPDNQIYCDDSATLKKTTISLSPVEREDRQTKMAVIRLSPTRAIVVQAHGIDKWSSFNAGDRVFPPGFYGVMAWILDLDKSVAAPINSDGTSLYNDEWAWGVFQKVHGGSSNKFDLQVGDRLNLADYVAVLGDSFVIEGVRIKVVGTGDFETIEISKE